MAHLRDGVRLNLLQLLLLFIAQFHPAALHQDELSEEFGLLEQEVEFLPTLHLWSCSRRNYTSLHLAILVITFRRRAVSVFFTSRGHLLGELFPLSDAISDDLALLLLLLLDCLSQRGRKLRVRNISFTRPFSLFIGHLDVGGASGCLGCSLLLGGFLSVAGCPSTSHVNFLYLSILF